MKKILLLLCFVIPSLTFAQEKQGAAQPNDNAKPVYEMMNFWFVMLMKGNNRTQDSATAAKLQAGHMANMGKMAAEGKLLIAGPFTDNANWRGIFIFKSASKDEVEAMLQQDPAIAAGRLAYEIHPWMTAKNCILK